MKITVWRGALSRRRAWPGAGPDYDAIEPVDLRTVPLVPHSVLARKMLTVAKVAVGSLSSPEK
jgi:hypothetical protein